MGGGAALLVVSVAIALFYAFCYWNPVVSLRNSLGGLFSAFQFDRFYWLYPCLWYLVFANALYFISVPKGHIISKIVQFLLVACVVVSIGKNNYLSGNLCTNMHRILNAGNLSGISWDAFFSEKLFKQIKEYIGRKPSEYRVASLGLYASVPLYNGFYCIDGYSNNYPVVYKHFFRGIIEAELDKNDDLRSYYDKWGNRCYIFVDQIPKQYFFDKNSTIILSELNLNLEKMKELGCEYIFSALPVRSSVMDARLSFVADFMNESSPYHIYVYQIL